MATPEESRKKSPKSEQSIVGKLIEWFPWFPRPVTNDDQPPQQQQEMVMGMQQRLFLETPAMHVAPPLLGEFPQQYVWPELPPGVSMKWKSIIDQLLVQGEGVDIKEKDDKQSENPFENIYKSPKPDLSELFQREH